MAEVLVAEGLGARTRRGWVFRDVDLVVEEGEFRTLAGAAGSGRTSLLLALAGYFRTTAGTVTRHAEPALGFVAGVSEPEPGLTVAEHVEERLVLLGRASWNLRRRRAQALGLLQEVHLPPQKLGRDLDRLQAQLLGLVLAQAGEPGIILADDVDSGLSEVERKTLREALEATGKTIIVTERAA